MGEQMLDRANRVGERLYGRLSGVGRIAEMVNDKQVNVLGI